MRSDLALTVPMVRDYEELGGKKFTKGILSDVS